MDARSRFFYDAFSSMLDQEAIRHPKQLYSEWSSTSFATHRALLVDWFFELQKKPFLRMRREVVFLAVDLLDGFFGATSYQFAPDRLQLVASAALLLSVKMLDDESHPRRIDEAVILLDYRYSCAQVAAMEVEILKTLGFCLNRATIYDFLNLLLVMLLPTTTTLDAIQFRELVMDVAILALLEYRALVTFPASTVALSILYLGILVSKNKTTLQALSRLLQGNSPLQTQLEECTTLIAKTCTRVLETTQDKNNKTDIPHILDTLRQETRRLLCALSQYLKVPKKDLDLNETRTIFLPAESFCDTSAASFCDTSATLSQMGDDKFIEKSKLTPESCNQQTSPLSPSTQDIMQVDDEYYESKDNNKNTPNMEGD